MTDPKSRKALQNLGRDLEVMSPWPGLLKFLILGAVIIPSIVIASRTDSLAVLIGATLLAALLYPAWMILTHDALHHTLTGWVWFDEVAPRLISYPMFWTHGLYASLHRMHHRMNGQSSEDPERVTYTREEYEGANPINRFLMRHQILVTMFIGGGIGLVSKNINHYFRLQKRSASMRAAFRSDLVGILIMHGGMYALLGGRWALMFLILERVSGAILQMRAQIEHYGLAGKRDNFVATQVYTSRNIKTAPLVSWYFNHLNFHSAHHAYPKVPFYNLEKVHRRLTEHCSAPDQEPLPSSAGYFSTTLRLAREPQFVDIS